MSTKYGNDYLDTDKQYLYTKKILDYDFITSIIPNLYNSDTEYIHKKQNCALWQQPFFLCISMHVYIYI